MSGSPPVSLEEAISLEGDERGFSVELSDAWEVWGPNGGYLAALALAAAGRCAELERPASVYCQFLRSPAFARVALTVEPLRRGRRAETFAVRMEQDGKIVLFAIVQTIAKGPGYEHQTVAAPDLPPPGRCEQFVAPVDFNFWKNLSRRRPQDAVPDGAPVLQEWARFEPASRFDDPFVDAARPLILLDTYGWPAAWMKYRGADYVAPSLDVSVAFHQRTESDWLLIDQHCPIGADGLLGAGGHVWDESGRLVASSMAQLCCLPSSG